jgi:hypothetical protein
MQSGNMRQSQQLRYLVPAMLFLAFLPVPALANIPMFWIIPLAKLEYWWTVLLAIVIEAVAIRWIFDFTWNRSAVAAMVVNFATFLLGFILYPAAGGILYPLVEPLVTRPTGGGELIGHRATLVLLLIVALLDSAVELALLRSLYKAVIVLQKALLFLLANLFTASIFFALLAR